MVGPISMAHNALTIHRADTFLSRFGGLLARPVLRAGEALHLSPCSSVHTLFMRYAIDVAFIDRDGRVLKIVAGLRPFRTASHWPADGVVELMAGEAARLGLDVGSVIGIRTARVNR